MTKGRLGRKRQLHLETRIAAVSAVPERAPRLSVLERVGAAASRANRIACRRRRSGRSASVESRLTTHEADAAAQQCYELELQEPRARSSLIALCRESQLVHRLKSRAPRHSWIPPPRPRLHVSSTCSSSPPPSVSSQCSKMRFHCVTLLVTCCGASAKNKWNVKRGKCATL